MRAYEDAVTETSTRYAPWYVVPADRKWVRNLVVIRLLVATLEEMDPQLPPAEEGIDGSGHLSGPSAPSGRLTGWAHRLIVSQSICPAKASAGLALPGFLPTVT